MHEQRQRVLLYGGEDCAAARKICDAILRVGSRAGRIVLDRVHETADLGRREASHRVREHRSGHDAGQQPDAEAHALVFHGPGILWRDHGCAPLARPGRLVSRLTAAAVTRIAPTTESEIQTGRWNQ